MYTTTRRPPRHVRMTWPTSFGGCHATQVRRRTIPNNMDSGMPSTGLVKWETHVLGMACCMWVMIGRLILEREAVKPDRGPRRVPVWQPREVVSDCGLPPFEGQYPGHDKDLIEDSIHASLLFAYHSLDSVNLGLRNSAVAN